MKQLVYGAVGLLFTIMAIFSITTLAQVSEREAEIKTALPNAVQSAVETTMEDGKYKIDDQKKFIAVFTKNLSDNINTGTDDDKDGNLRIDVKVAGVDTEKGLLSVEATEYYSKMNGKIGKETCNATVLMDKTEKAEVKRQTSKVTFKFDDGTVIWEGAKDSLLDEQPKELGSNPTDAEKAAYEDAKTKYQLHVQDQIEKLIDKANSCLEERFVVLRINSTGERKYIPKDKYDEYKAKYLVNGDYSEEDLHPLDPKNATDLWEQTKQISPTADINFVFKGSSVKPPDPIPHKITFEGNGGTVNGQNVYVKTLDSLADGTVMVLPNAVKPGCDFLGWYTDIEGNTPISDTNRAGNTYNVEAGETTVYAHYMGKEGTIAYNLDGGDLKDPKTGFTTTDPDFTLQTPIKDGYTFLGWTGSNGDTPNTNVTVSPKTGRLKYEFIASWKETTYTVTLHDLKGSDFSYKNPVTKKDKFILGSPEKRGYDFLGWTGEGIKTPVKNIVIENTDHDLVYTANWQEGNNYYVTLKYTKDKSQTIMVEKGKSIAIPDYTIDNKYLTGVYDESGNMVISGYDLKNPSDNTGMYTPTKLDTTLTYKWEEGTYTVKFNANGGTGEMPDQKVPVHSNESPDANKFSFGENTFDGWSLTRDGPKITDSKGNAIFNDLTDGGNTITVYARWIRLYSTLTVDMNDGSDKSNITVRNGSTYTIGKTVKPGYTFVKWELSGAGTIDNDKYTAGNGNATLKAIWLCNEYTAVFNSNGGSTGQQTRTETLDGIMILPTDPVKTSGSGSHYTFAGWYTDPISGTQITAGTKYTWTQNMVFYAHWTEHAHNFGGWTITKQPSCTEYGSRSRYCATCGYREDEVINPSGHNFTWVIDSYASCTSNGTEHQRCTVCGETRNYGTVWQSAYGHDWEWIHDSNASCTENGTEHRHCKRCGETDSYGTVWAYAYGHNYVSTGGRFLGVQDKLKYGSSSKASVYSWYEEKKCSNCGSVIMVEHKDITWYKYTNNVNGDTLIGYYSSGLGDHREVAGSPDWTLQSTRGPGDSEVNAQYRSYHDSRHWYTDYDPGNTEGWVANWN